MKRFAATCFVVCCLFASLPQLRTAHAQNTSFLSGETIRLLTNEISGDRAFEHIRWLSHWHRDSGMEGFFKAAEYVQQAAKEAGLQDVRFVEQTRPGPNYTARLGELWMEEPVEVKLADIGDSPLVLADGSHDANLSAELVYAGDASESSLQGIDVSGKIVLTTSAPQVAVDNAVYAKGAVGVVSYTTSESKNPMDHPDQIAWTRIAVTPPSGKKATFAFTLSPRKGDMLRRLLQTTGPQDIFATGKRTPGGRVVLKAKVHTEIGEAPGRTGFVEGWIRGTKYHDQEIVLTAHLQEEKPSANDDGSGCASILEIARSLNKLIAEGKIPRPLRDIRFWWTDEIYSEGRFFRDHPEEVKKLLANVHQDMVGANQSMGSRVQHLILAPHSRTSYLDTIFQSIGTYVIQTNNAFLAAGRQGGLPRPHSRPIYSVRGTRSGYTAAFVPYFDSSDHLTFLDGPIGVPAVAMINWDDDYIHSSDDELDKIDQTQLQRNSFIIAGTAFVLAFAEAKDVPVLAGETFSQGDSRLANDLKAAMRVLEESAGSSGGGWKVASMLIEQGVQREMRALNSIRVFAGSDRSAAGIIGALVSRMEGKQQELTADLSAFYQQLHGAAPQPIQLSADELEATKKVPSNVGSIETYYANRANVHAQVSLHGLMQSEVYNFVDGKRSYYDIYKAVNAEAMAAGSWYYGTVSLKDVVDLLDAAVQANALVLK